MVQVYNLVPEGALPTSALAARYMFDFVNRWLQEAGRSPQFQVVTVGLRPVVMLPGGLSISVDAVLPPAQASALVVIPPMAPPWDESLQQNHPFVPWLRTQHQSGAVFASLCFGAFLLGEAGLLNHRQCTTHWQAARQFQQRYPLARLQPAKIITEDQGIFTSGGASASWTLLLYLVERYVGREAAIAAAKFFVLDLDKLSQLPYADHDLIHPTQDALVLAAQLQIVQHGVSDLQIAAVAAQHHVSRRTLERRFRAATHLSIQQYHQQVKLKFIKRQLEMSQASIADIAAASGYQDLKSFRDRFRALVGISPQEYRQKFHRSTVQLS